MSSHNNKKLLVIASHYRNFIKDQVEVIAHNFKEINVIIRYNPFFGFGGNIFYYLKKYQKSNLYNDKNKPDNVHLFFSTVYYLPTTMFYQRLGDNYYKSILNCIIKNKIDFDLIHAHLTFPNGYTGVKLSKQYDVPIVITIHENRNWFLHQLESNDDKIFWTWKNANAIIRVNKKDIQYLKKYNPNTYLIGNGYSPERFKYVDIIEARNKLSLPKDKIILFSLGNLIKRKGFQYLITAMNYIAKNRKDVLCFIGGNGQYKQTLKTMIKKYNLKDYVTLIGFVPEELLSYWMNAADLFVFPSLSESFGLVVLEALAVGTPSVATINGGSEEIISSDDYGILVEPANSIELYKKINFALKKDWDADKIRKFAEQFSWNNIEKEIMQVYKNC